MTFRERSPPGHPAKQHEASERMKVGTVTHSLEHPCPSFHSSFLHNPIEDAIHSRTLPLPVNTASESRPPFSYPLRSKSQPFQETLSVIRGWDRTTPPRQPSPSTGDERRGVNYDGNDGLYALSEAGERRRQEDHERGREGRELHQLEDRNSLTRGASPKQSSIPPYPPFPTLIEPWSQQPKHERLTGPEIQPQTNPQLPSFRELLDSTNSSPDTQSAHTKSPPAAMDHWQTPSARTSRQSSAERPVFHDPFRGAQPPNLPSRSSTHNARPTPSIENYTTQIEGRPSLLQARPSANYDSRRTSSLRADYEPRVPPSEPRLHSLPSIFNPRINPPAPVVTSTVPQIYHQPGGYPATIPITEAHRYNEAAYGHLAYPNEHHMHRSPFASDHARASVRHDSSVFPTPEHHWMSPPYTYQAGGYVYGVDSHNGMDTYPVNNRRRRGNLPKEATALLKKWFQDHSDSPYPTDEDKNRLAMDTGLTAAQISNWFINARRRNPGKEAREQARALNNNKSSVQQQTQGTNGTQDQDLSVQPSASSPLQQPRHPSQQHAERRYSLAHMQAPKPYPYDPRDHSHDTDREMGNA